MSGGVPVLDVMALGVLLVALPLVSVAQLRLLRDVAIERIPVYISSALTLVLLGGICLALGMRRGGPAAVGLAVPPVGDLLLWTAGLTVAGLAIMFAFRALGIALGLEESPLLRALLPRSGRERTAFAGLSLAAGIGEEVAYRGYAIPLLAVALGPAAAVGVSAVAFGVMHAYQGALGVVRTTALGALLGSAFLASGSLWAPVLAHTALDMLAGIVLADRLLER